MSGNRLIAVDAATGALADGFGDDGAVTVGVPYGGTPTIIATSRSSARRRARLPQGPPGNPRAFDVDHRQEAVGVPDRSQARARSTTRPGATAGRTVRAPTCGRSPRRSMSSAASSICRSPARRRTTTAAIARATTRLRNSIVAVDAQTGQVPLALPDRAPRHLGHRHADRRARCSTSCRTDAARRRSRTSASRAMSSCSIASTGKPLIPVEERPVPKGDVPTEWYSPTQPFPVRPGR